MSTASGQTGSPFSGVSIAVALISQAAVASALLLYLGYVYTDSLFGYFGLYVGTLGLSTTDLVSRSVSVVANPTIVGFILIGVFTVIDAHLVRGMPVAAKMRLAVGAAALSSILAFLGMLTFMALRFTVVGTVGITTSAAMFSLCAVSLGRMPSASVRWRYRPTRYSCWALGIVALFLATSSYGLLAGVNRAQKIDLEADSLPLVSIVASKDLAITGPGVHRQLIIGTNPKPEVVRYSGLRLLLQSGDRLFLLPQQWRRGVDAALVVRTSDLLGVEVRAGRDVAR